jgi:SAM-dependent methyltransferase
MHHQLSGYDCPLMQHPLCLAETALSCAAMWTPATPQPPDPPAHLREGTGLGDFWKTGFDTVNLIEQFAGLKSDDRILDIGCGLGRVAWPLVQRLGDGGSYDGFDTLPAYIEWCRTGLGLDPARVRFHQTSVYSSFYNPEAATRAAELRFPFEDEQFTLAIANSLFTHLTAPDTVNYLREAARCLKHGGRLYATFFVLDDQSRSAIGTGDTYPSFRHEIEHGLTSDPEKPEAAIALEIDWLHQQYLDAGYKIDAYVKGTWRRSWGPTLQDIVVASKV